MIDYVHLVYDVHIPRSRFDSMKWYRALTMDGEECFVHVLRGVKIRYYPERERMTIKGKLLMLLRDTQVQNVDDVYGADTERFIEDINAYLNRLVPSASLDIRRFIVKRIDYCFNVKTEHVKTYIKFLNSAFERYDGGGRKNHAQEKGLEGSVYVKTKSDYEHNSRRNYVLNYYDKEDCLRKLKKGIRAKEADLERAKDVLRLEVQCGFGFISQLCKKLHITNLFQKLFDYKVAVIAHELVYERVFGADKSQDYYKYNKTKEMIWRKSKAAERALFSASTNHSIREKKYAYGRKVLKEAGIYPYCSLANDCDVDWLENPLRLIRNKLESIGIETTNTIK